MKNVQKSQNMPNPAPADTVRISGVAGAAFTILTILGTLGVVWMAIAGVAGIWIALTLAVTLILGFYILLALKVAKQWEKAVVLRLGKFQGLRGPGMFWIVPIIDSTPVWIDHRVMVTPFNAEKTLTKDTT